MKKFLFINLEKVPSFESLLIANDYKEVHINLLILENHKVDIKDMFQLFEKLNHPNLYFYSKKIENIHLLEMSGNQIHYSWINNEKLDEDFIKLVNKNLNNEFFWVINDSLLAFSKEEILKNLQKIRRPICISFTKTLLNKDNLNYKKLKDLIAWIQKNWDNTLFNKEKDLYVENWVDEKYLSWKDNVYYSPEEGKVKKLVMGIYGDVAILDEQDNEKNNILNLKKNKECLFCEYFTFCRERGIGLIMKEINLHECISVNFLKNNT